MKIFLKINDKYLFNGYTLKKIIFSTQKWKILIIVNK